MLKLYISNKIENLSQQFAKNINTYSDVFSKELVISQTSGMERWLSLQTAEHNGIFTNFNFIKPNSFVNQLYQLAELKANDIYSTENLKWIIYHLLEHEEFKTQFPQVSDYYIHDDIKKLQLSVKLADLFDQYLLYRQNYIEAWNQNKPATVKRQKDDTDKQFADKQSRLDQHQKWQMWLWNQIKQTIKDDNLDKVQLKVLLKNKFKEPEFKARIKEKYNRISLFGLSVITDYHIEIFHYLSDFIDVHLYFLNPSPETYWYDIVNEKFVFYLEQKTGKTAQELKMHIGNEILGNNSSLAKDTFNILFKNDAFIDAIEDFQSEAPIPKHLLGKIQNDLYNNLHLHKNPITDQDLNDDSLIISSSYTMAREVEALYNQLLLFFEKDKNLQAHDIIIQLSDVDAYTPYIRAIFGNAPYPLPYSIADRSYTGGDNLLGALETVLEMRFEDFTSEQVVQLLNSEFISKQFGINNIDLIRQAVDQANIRFGVKGYKEDDTKYLSWTFGLERLILGYAISGSDAYSVGDYSTFPLDTIEGAEMEEVFKFKKFVDELILSIEARQADRNIIEWGTYTLDVIKKLLWVDENSNNEIRYIQKHIESFTKMSQWFNEDISYDVYKKSLLDALFSNPRAGNFINGSITFCSMIPMRSIPFKVVAMLGLNGDIFPRQENKVAFNLMDIEYQRGDRNTKNNDKYLFLETVLSTRNNLYLSYIGKSTGDNSELPPSILIEELQRYLALSYQGNKSSEAIEKALVVQHPLQSFSKRYNKEEKLISYSKEQNSISTVDSKVENKSLSVPEHVNLDQWLRFYTDPFKYYYNQVLKIYYEEESDLIPEAEMFLPNFLEQHYLKSNLLFNQDETLEAFIDKGKKLGFLPLGHMAEVVSKDYLSQIALLKDNLKKHTLNYKAESQTLDLNINNIALKGKLYPVYNKNYIHVSVSRESSEIKTIMNAWLTHLLISASHKDINTIYLSPTQQKPLIFSKDLIKPEDAQALIQKLMNYWVKGQKQNLAFMPQVGFDLAKALYKAFGDEEKIKDKCLRAFESVKNKGLPSPTSGYYNRYIKKEIDAGFFESTEESISDLKDLSWLIFGDLIKQGLI